MVGVTPPIETGSNFTVVEHGSNISSSSSSNAHLSPMRFCYRLDSSYRNRAQSYMHRALRKQNDIYNSSLKMPIFPSVRLVKTCLSPKKTFQETWFRWIYVPKITTFSVGEFFWFSFIRPAQVYEGLVIRMVDVLQPSKAESKPTTIKHGKNKVTFPTAGPAIIIKIYQRLHSHQL